MDATSIGVKAQNAGNIVASRPVATIVREALLVELRKNSHLVVSDEPDMVLAAAVEEFRLDEVVSYASTRYVGRVVIAVTIVGRRSGDILLAKRYVGIKRREVEKSSDDARRETMDAALARTMHDLATDPELAKALVDVRTAELLDMCAWHGWMPGLEASPRIA
jgi:NMD protein affecting ribosome stability and mRNA decay